MMAIAGIGILRFAGVHDRAGRKYAEEKF